MPYSIEFQIAGLCVVATLTLVFFSKPRWQSLQNSVFRFLLPLTILELLFDIISVITITERYRLPTWLNDFFSKGYLIVMLLWITLSVVYVFSNFVYEGISEHSKKVLGFLLLCIIIPFLVCCVIVFVMPLYYGGKERYVYSYGIPSKCVYFYSTYVVIFSVIVGLVNHSHVKFKRMVPLLSFAIMEGSVALFQMFFPLLLIVGFGSALSILVMYMTLENPDMDMIARLDKANKLANRLLVNILPVSVARELKENMHPFTEKYNDVTISFMDIVNFTEMSSVIGAEKLVTILNDLFTEFDSLTDNYRIEKIKTIGDAYMVAAGLPERYEDNCQEMMKFLVQAMSLVKDFNVRYNTSLHMRIGMHCGTVVAGVIGKKKFIYDIWGATVNYAFRLESYSYPDRIQVSENVFQKLKDSYDFERRDSVAVKGIGECTCYLLK